MDTILVESDVVIQRWVGTPVGNVPPPATGDLIEVPDGTVVVGMTQTSPGVFAPPAETAQQTREKINRERQRRFDAGFSYDFGGAIGVKTFDTDAESRANIAGGYGLALGAIIAGATPDDLRWATPDEDFEWTAADNAQVPMDAQTCLAFCRAAMSYKVGVIKAAQALKNADPIPANYEDDAYWP